jgi:predicted RNase H-like HicB family nuclease
MNYKVLLYQSDEGYSVACPGLPGCWSQGETEAEALANIKDAMDGYIASLRKHNEPIPPPISEEVVEVSP